MIAILFQILLYNLPLSELSKQTSRKKNVRDKTCVVILQCQVLETQDRAGHRLNARSPLGQTHFSDAVRTCHLACGFLSPFLSYFFVSGLFSFYPLNDHN